MTREKRDFSVAMLTREWPPRIYGGAGVHVRNLVSAIQDVSGVTANVHCFGEPRSDAQAHELITELAGTNPALQTLLIDADMAKSLSGNNLVHSHTWYTNFAGYLAQRSYRIPHVITAHSLEPLRPWKAEQLGGGYQISSWIERISYESADAIIAVSDGMKRDLLDAYPAVDPRKVHTIRNGIDIRRFAPRSDSALLTRLGIAEPFALFVGRITRQKGLAHLLRAWRDISPEFGLVLAASSPDEPAIGAEVEMLIAELQTTRSNVIWIKEMLRHEDLVALLTAARAFVCPSIYEPLGIVNLEAMACETAVVASAVGGIPEVVVDGETGLLVRFDEETFEQDLSKAITKVMSDETLATRYGRAGQVRAAAQFGWDKVAESTINLYRSLI